MDGALSNKKEDEVPENQCKDKVSTNDVTFYGEAS